MVRQRIKNDWEAPYKCKQYHVQMENIVLGGATRSRSWWADTIRVPILFGYFGPKPFLARYVKSCIYSVFDMVRSIRIKQRGLLSIEAWLTTSARIPNTMQTLFEVRTQATTTFFNTSVRTLGDPYTQFDTAKRLEIWLHINYSRMNWIKDRTERRNVCISFQSWWVLLFFQPVNGMDTLAQQH